MDESFLEDCGRRTTAEVVDELDSLTAAGNRIQRELFRALIRCDLRRVWIDDDSRDLAHWVSLRLGISVWKARRWVECAWALEDFPSFSEAFEDGLLSVDKLVELTRLARAVNESDETLLRWGLKESPAALRDRADWARKVADEVTRQADQQRSLKWWWEDDHAYVNLYASLPADMGIRVTSALDRLARKLPQSPEDLIDDKHPEVSLEACRADALDLLAGQAIAADHDADRATVVVHAPLSVLTDADRNGTGSKGESLHPEVVRRLSCDCRLQMVLHGDDGGVVGIGMTSGLIPKWLRRQVEARDGFRCTFPNCGSRLGTDAHHVVAWPKGPTELDNLTLLCRTHHRLVHEHGWHVTLAADQSARWFRPDWTPYVPRPPAPAVRRQETPEPELPEQDEAYAATTKTTNPRWRIPTEVLLGHAAAF